MNATLADAVETTGRVVATRRLGEYMVLTLRAPEVARRTIPGQFAMVDSGAQLRRPFSVFRAEQDTIAIAYDVIGAGTRRLATHLLGDELTLAGPLGRGFSMDAEGPTIAVGGGYGAAPLFLFAERVRPAGHAVHAIIGAARATRVFGSNDAETTFDSVTFTTDDGSLGEKGLVTDALESVAKKTKANRVIACGPMPMLAAVSARCRELNLACEVAVEEFMACGIGVCWTCVVPTRDGAYVRSCTEGPVFDGAEVAWG